MFLIFIALAEHPLSDIQLGRLERAFVHPIREYPLLVNSKSLSTYLLGPELPSSRLTVGQTSASSFVPVSQTSGSSSIPIG